MGVHAGVAGDGRRELGAWGEEVAARYLSDHGLQVIDRNWRCRHGEIDIIARDGRALVVCEVKTRRSTGFGDPVEAVTWRKYARLRRLAGAWLADRDEAYDAIRIDVVGVLHRPGDRAMVRHLVGVC